MSWVAASFRLPCRMLRVGRKSMVVETVDVLGGDGGGGEDASGLVRRLVFGPWLATAKIRPPRSMKTSSAAKKTAGPGATPAGPGDSSDASRKTSGQPSSPDSPLDLAGWQKPAKVARRRSPPKDQTGASAVMECGTASAFDPLSETVPLDEDLPPGQLVLFSGPKVAMAEAGSGLLHLKRARSPPRLLPAPETPVVAPVLAGGDRGSLPAGGVSAAASVGRRLPTSWKVTPTAAASSTGHAEDGRSAMKGKGKVSVSGRIPDDDSSGPAGAEAPVSSDPVSCVGGKEDGGMVFSLGSHGRVVWRAKEALGLHDIQKQPAQSHKAPHSKLSQAKTVKGNVVPKVKAKEASAHLEAAMDHGQVGDTEGPLSGARGLGSPQELE